MLNIAKRIFNHSPLELFSGAFYLANPGRISNFVYDYSIGQSGLKLASNTLINPAFFKALDAVILLRSSFSHLHDQAQHGATFSLSTMFSLSKLLIAGHALALYSSNIFWLSTSIVNHANNFFSSTVGFNLDNARFNYNNQTYNIGTQLFNQLIVGLFVMTTTKLFDEITNRIFPQLQPVRPSPVVENPSIPAIALPTVESPKSKSSGDENLGLDLDASSSQDPSSSGAVAGAGMTPVLRTPPQHRTRTATMGGRYDEDSDLEMTATATPSAPKPAIEIPLTLGARPQQRDRSATMGEGHEFAPLSPIVAISDELGRALTPPKSPHSDRSATRS